MKKFLTLFVATGLLVAVLAGAALAAEPMAKDQVLQFNLGAEPQTLDPAKSTGIPEAIMILNLFEGLTRLDENNEPQPAIAKSWDVSNGGTVYTFHLRDAKWSNGDAVTAHDFEYAWKRALAPETASEYAYQLYYIKNGQDYNEGKIKDAGAVGVKAVDDHTLRVVLEAPTPYFLSLTAFPTLLPVDQKVVKGNANWATKPETHVGNGPFKITKWVHNSQAILEKNPSYWDADVVKLQKIEVALIDSQMTAITMFDTGQLDYNDNIAVSEIDRLKKEGKFQVAPYLGTYYYLFNVTKKPFDDVRVRKALALAIDRKAIVELVTKAGQKPALAFVPPGVKGFREAGKTYFKDNDVFTARKLLADAGYPGGKGFPTVELLYNTSESHKVIAEAIQQMWKKNLGINIRLTNQEWKVYLDTRTQLNYQVARAGWIGDYVDPMTFLDMWLTGGGNNDTGWSNKRYDALIEQSKTEEDMKKRDALLHEAEDILMNDMPIMPIYFYTLPFEQKDFVKDLNRSTLGFIDFKHTWIAKH